VPVVLLTCIVHPGGRSRVSAGAARRPSRSFTALLFGSNRLAVFSAPVHAAAPYGRVPR